MDSVNILMLSNDFLPNIGGISAHVAGLSRALTELGHRVTVAVPRAVWPWKRPRVVEEHIDGIRTIRVDIPHVPKTGRWLYSPLVARFLRRLIQREGYQVLHWHTFEHRSVRRLNRVAKVFTNHSSGFLGLVADSRNLPLASAIVEPAQAVIAPSRELATATGKAGFPTDHVYVIPNGVNTERFSPGVDGNSVRQRYGIAPDECVIICPRRLAKKNGVIYWVRAIPRLLAHPVARQAKLRFLFVGDYLCDNRQSARAEVLQGIAQLGLGEQILFAGAVPNQDMPTYFAASDIVVIPSLVEATSIAALEAMSTGKPIVATNVGGLPAIITHGENGLLVPPADPEALAVAVGDLVADPPMHRRLGHAGRQRAMNEFSWTIVAERTLAVYHSVIVGE